jgi:hypothetical protein
MRIGQSTLSMLMTNNDQMNNANAEPAVPDQYVQTTAKMSTGHGPI